jgi:hypothetical protein
VRLILKKQYNSSTLWEKSQERKLVSKRKKEGREGGKEGGREGGREGEKERCWQGE